MEFIEGLLKAGLTIAFLIFVVVALAALLMVVLGIATGIDDKIQQ